MQTGAQATNSPISLRIQFGQTTKEGAGLIHSHSVTSPRKPIIPFLWWALRSSPHSTNGFWFKPIYPAGRWLNWLLSTASCITDARGGKEASTSVGRLTQHQMHGNFPFGTEFQLFDPPKRVSRSLVTRQEKQVKMKLSGKILNFYFLYHKAQNELQSDLTWHEMTRNDTEWHGVTGHLWTCFVMFCECEDWFVTFCEFGDPVSSRVIPCQGNDRMHFLRVIPCHGVIPSLRIFLPDFHHYFSHLARTFPEFLTRSDGFLPALACNS
jgi:hypothetical protein